MRKLSFKGLLVCAASALEIVCCMAQEEEKDILERERRAADSMRRIQKVLYADGGQIQAKLHVDEGDNSLAYSSWSCPTSIVVRGNAYQVIRKELSSQFAYFPEFKKWHLCVLAEDGTLGLDGELTQTRNERQARLECFTSFAMNDMGAQWVASHSTVSFPVRNLMRVEYREGDRGNTESYVSRNLCFRLFSKSAVAPEFMIALINAGVPESERIVLSPQVP